MRARAHAGLTATEVLALARNAFEVAWLTPRVRDGFLAELDAHAAAFGVTG